jgi:hypothetical protein
MSICTPCAKANRVFKCSETLTIGQLANTTAYLVSVSDVTNGFNRMYAVTSTNTGLVSIDTDELPTKHTLRIEVTNTSGEALMFGVWDGTDYTAQRACVDVMLEVAEGAPSSQILTVE